MNKTIKFKILLDIIAAFFIILIMNVTITGVLWHEILGIVILSVIIIHIVLNGKWIKQVSRNILSRKVNGKSLFMYILDVALVIGFILSTISGIFISESLFTFWARSNRAFWLDIHSSVSYISFIIISIHIGMHWQYIMAVFKRMTGLAARGRVSKLALRTFAGILAAFGIVSFVNQNIIEKICSAFQYEYTGTGGNYQNNKTEASKASQQGSSSDTDISLVELNAETVSLNKLNSQDQTKDTGDSGSSDSITALQEDTAELSQDVTLEEYLSGLHCNLCGRMCLLISPSCQKGETLAKQAIENYYSMSFNSSQDTSVLPQENDEHNDKFPIPFSDDLSIMGFFVAGTYYSFQLASKQRKRTHK